MMNVLKNLGEMLTNAYKERYEREFAAKYDRIYRRTKNMFNYK